MNKKLEKQYNLVKGSKPGKGLKLRGNNGKMYYQTSKYRHLPIALKRDLNDIGLHFKNNDRFVYKGEGNFRPSGDRYFEWNIYIEDADIFRLYEFFEVENRYGDTSYLIRDTSIMREFSKTLEHNWIYEFGLSKTKSEYDEDGEKRIKNERFVIRGIEGIEVDGKARRKWDYFYRPLKQPIKEVYEAKLEKETKERRKLNTNFFVRLVLNIFLFLFGIYLMMSFNGFFGGLIVFLSLLFIIPIYRIQRQVNQKDKLVRTLQSEQKELLDQFPNNIPTDEEMQQFLKEDLEHVLINEVKKKNMFDSLKNTLGPGSSLSQKWAREQGCIEIVELGFFQPGSINERSHYLTDTKLRTIRLTNSGELLGRIYALLFIFPTTEKLVIHSSIFDFITMKLMNEFNIDFYYKDIIQIKDEVKENKSTLIDDERDSIQEILTLNLEFAGGQSINIAHPLEESLKYLEKEMRQFNKLLKENDSGEKSNQEDLKRKERINYDEIKRKSQRARQIANFLRTTWNENLLSSATTPISSVLDSKLDPREVSNRIWDALENPYKF